MKATLIIGVFVLSSLCLLEQADAYYRYANGTPITAADDRKADEAKGIFLNKNRSLLALQTQVQQLQAQALKGLDEEQQKVVQARLEELQQQQKALQEEIQAETEKAAGNAA